ncbi:MAG: hypothetical protein R2860_02310 [Desulfobacterales bacterium]
MAQDFNEHCIAVMPFIKGKHPENIEETMTCPYSSFCFEAEALLTDADDADPHVAGLIEPRFCRPGHSTGTGGKDISNFKD